MADADLDVVIRNLAKQQNKSLMAAVKSRRDRFTALAAKAKDKDARERFKQIAKTTMDQGTAAARRLLMSADNAADSYARSIRLAAEAASVQKVAPAKPEAAPKKAVVPKNKKPAKKAAKKTKA
jgi:hypothetical protein